MARQVNGRPREWVKTLPSEINVLPVPHSATAAAQREFCQCFVMPIIARVWAGNGRLFNRCSSGQTGSALRRLLKVTRRCLPKLTQAALRGAISGMDWIGGVEPQFS
jgi:hypothetical protein